ncbi:MAG: hypothetical protein ABIJ18_04745 [archaeon]
MAKSIVWRILLKLIALIVFFVIILVANIVAIFVNNPFFNVIMSSINSSWGLIFIIVLLFFFKEVFEMLPFPLNLPYPLLNAVATTILISFLFDLIAYSNIIPDWNSLFPVLQLIVYPLVIILIIFIGYLDIFRKQKRKKKLPKFKKHRKVKRSVKKSRKKVKKKSK